MRRINYYFNARLTEICKQAFALESLNQMLQQTLPTHLQPHCQVSSFNNGCMVIMVDDPVWTSELRYFVPELRDSLRKDAGLYKLSSIKIVLAEPINNLPKRNKALKLSNHARTTLRQGSDQCQYEPLKEALLALSKSDHEEST